MKAAEFLFEASLTASQMRKHAGKYLKTLIRKIEDGEPVEIVPDRRDEFGDNVILKKSNIKRLLQAWFGTTSWPDTDDMDLDITNQIRPADKSVTRLTVETTSGVDVPMSALLKTNEYKGGTAFNTGDVAEGILGAAVTAKFLAAGKDITQNDIIKVINELGPGELLGKSSLKGTMSGTVNKDKVYFNLVLGMASYNALYGAVKSKDLHPAILGLMRSSVSYANRNAAIESAIQQVTDDPNSNRISVRADGISDQRGTKADLFLDIDGTTINLLSLKAGQVKQFGQSSGYNFNQLDNFFRSTFGVSIGKETAKQFVSGDSVTSFRAIHNVYNKVGKEINKDLSGHNVAKETKFLENLYNGIRNHATGGNDKTSMVILKTTPNAPGYVQLDFGERLKKAMESVDLYVVNKSGDPQNLGQAAIEIRGRTALGKDYMLLRLRSNFKRTEGAGYVRNIIEMGLLLKVLAKIEDDVSANSD